MNWDERQNENAGTDTIIHHRRVTFHETQKGVAKLTYSDLAFH